MKKFLILIPLCFLLIGCSVIWSDDVFIGTLFKNVDAGNIEMIAEPNYLQMGSDILKSKNDSIKVATPTAIISTGDVE